MAWLRWSQCPGSRSSPGSVFVLLPAFGYFPALGGDDPLAAAVARPDRLSGAGVGRARHLDLRLRRDADRARRWRCWRWLGRAIGPDGQVRRGLPRIAAKFLSWLLATPHAAFALGLAFLVAPSGWLVRIAALVVADRDAARSAVAARSLGLQPRRRPGAEGNAVPVLRRADRACSQLGAARMLGIGASLGYARHRLAQADRAAALSPDPAAGLCGAGLCVVGSRHGAGPGARRHRRPWRCWRST